VVWYIHELGQHRSTKDGMLLVFIKPTEIL
jgi:hypothetical protein